MPTAILADDERLMRDQLRSRLEQVWPELTILDEAKNGDEAIQLVEKHHPDFVFLDIRMPVKTGLEAAKEIGNKAHIIFITAYDQYAIEAFDHGAVDYVLKPADVERLTKTVERLKSRLNSQTQPNGHREQTQLPPMDSSFHWAGIENDSRRRNSFFSVR